MLELLAVYWLFSFDSSENCRVVWSSLFLLKRNYCSQFNSFPSLAFVPIVFRFKRLFLLRFSLLDAFSHRIFHWVPFCMLHSAMADRGTQFESYLARVWVKLLSANSELFFAHFEQFNFRMDFYIFLRKNLLAKVTANCCQKVSRISDHL